MSDAGAIHEIEGDAADACVGDCVGGTVGGCAATEGSVGDTVATETGADVAAICCGCPQAVSMNNITRLASRNFCLIILSSP